MAWVRCCGSPAKRVNPNLLEYTWSLVNSSRDGDAIVLTKPTTSNGSIATMTEAFDVTNFNAIAFNYTLRTNNNYSFYFRLEYSTDGSTWSSLEFKESPSATGSATYTKLFDVSNLTGLYYFRARATDGNNDGSYAKINTASAT